MSGMLSYAYGGELKDIPQMDGSFSTDDLTAQNIDSFSTSQSCLYDVVLVFDASGSLEGRFEEQLKVANRLIDVFDVDTGETQIAAIKYAGKGKCRLIFDFK
ncbi:hypothetical protein Y032_0029g1878 [Ancylostoma ceylanicum]|uniref:VWFA domain-containing protein n=1 Tax=Ancylostoma ceylanicum TaxID=53326 RepID=A0A016URG5_9BILA|nr:hypothetical protein Y032_0029g1878 [Ancylostoma ceylanicum]